MLAGLEPHCLARRDADFLSCTRIASNPSLSGPDIKDPESPELDPLPSHHGVLHHFQNRIYRDLRLSLGQARALNYALN